MLAVVALAIGSAVGLESHLATASGKPHSGQSNPSDLDLQSSKVPPPGMHVAFDQTFTGSSLNTQVWNTCYWYADPGVGCGHSGVYNEDEWYLPSQDQVSDGALHLVVSPGDDR